MFFKRFILIALLSLSVTQTLAAKVYQIVDTSSSLVGEIVQVQADRRETLLDIGRRHGFGYHDMKLVNPEVDIWLPEDGEMIIIPSSFVLPHAPRNGIVINIPEMRLYYYLPKQQGNPQEVLTYPLGVGREGWNTPYMTTRIVEKKKHPDWYPPESIRKEHEEAGDPLPGIVKAGPDNPLGDYAMRLSKREYLIHGTNKPYGVGMRVSHGCIRLYPEDIEALFAQVAIETTVNIINQPYKVGIQNDVIYLEAHPYLEEEAEQFENNLTSVMSLILQFAGDRDYEVDWAAAYEAINNPTGIPIAIGIFMPRPMQISVKDKPRPTI